MSIPVALDDLPATVGARRGGAYLLTTGDARPRATSTGVQVDGGVLRVGAGRRTSENLARHPGVALLWPPVDGEEHALLVDGTAAVEAGVATITPSGAILHVIRG